MAYLSTDDGSQIYYEHITDHARKPNLLLLSGLLGTNNNQWKRFTNVLTPVYHLLFADLRGHGLSENKEGWLNPQTMMQDLVTLLDYLNIDTIHVAGYSLGGYLGLMLALNQPRRVATLLMHATKFYWTKETVAQTQQQFIPEHIAEKAPRYAEQLAEEHGAQRWRPLVRQASDLVAYLVDNGVTESMARQTPCSVLVSVGDHDEMVPLPEAYRLSRLVPKGALFTLPYVRHPFASIQPVPLLPMMQAFHTQE